MNTLNSSYSACLWIKSCHGSSFKAVRNWNLSPSVCGWLGSENCTCFKEFEGLMSASGGLRWSPSGWKWFYRQWLSMRWAEGGLSASKVTPQLLSSCLTFGQERIAPQDLGSQKSPEKTHLLSFKLTFIKELKTLRAGTIKARSYRHLEEAWDARNKAGIQNRARCEDFKGKLQHPPSLSPKWSPSRRTGTAIYRQFAEGHQCTVRSGEPSTPQFLTVPARGKYSKNALSKSASHI